MDPEILSLTNNRLRVGDFRLYPHTAERAEEAFRHLRRTPERGLQSDLTKK